MGDEIAKPENAQRLDVNGDGQFTIGDLPGLLLEGFFLPGDWLVWAVMTHVPSFARFLELDPGDYGSVLSGSVSGLVWLAFVLLVATTYRSVRNFDDEVAIELERGHGETREILNRLVELGFVHATLGGGEGERAHRLTRAGRAYLTFLELGARPR